MVVPQPRARARAQVCLHRAVGYTVLGSTFRAGSESVGAQGRSYGSRAGSKLSQGGDSSLGDVWVYVDARDDLVL